jgi:hypothetical protein
MELVTKANFRYQNGYLYEHHGAWRVRYRQRISQEDGSSRFQHVPQHLGRCKDFSILLRSSSVGYPSCKPSIAIGSAQILESH